VVGRALRIEHRILLATLDHVLAFLKGGCRAYIGVTGEARFRDQIYGGITGGGGGLFIMKSKCDGAS